MNFQRNLSIVTTLILVILTSASGVFAQSVAVAAMPDPVLQCMGQRITNVTYSPWNSAEDEWLQSPWRNTAPSWMDTVVQILDVLEARPVMDAAIEDLYGLVGTGVWLGYPPAGVEFAHGQHGFDMPEDVYGLFKLLGTGDQGQEVVVWFIASDTTPETLYVLPFRTTELFARPDGSYYGIHPCGAYSTPAEPVIEIVNGILD